MEREVAADGVSGIAAGAGIKAVLGLKGSLIAMAVAGLASVLSVVVGFTVVPLEQGNELRDASRRLACGLLTSFSLGPLSAAYVAKEYPWYPEGVTSIIGDPVIGFIASVLPFAAMSGLLGFWLVAAVMRWAQRRKDKDLAEIVSEIRGDDTKQRTAFARSEPDTEF